MSDTATVLLDPPDTEQHNELDPTAQVYLDAVPARKMWIDRNYQRDLDEVHARRIANAWNPRKVGALHVSDRGEDRGIDRYAVVDGQHRWAAAMIKDPNLVLVANVHVGLSPRDEAQLFHELHSTTKHLSPWDVWKARRGSGDADVLAIEAIVEKAGMRIAMATKNGNVRSIATLEKIYKLGGKELLSNTLQLIVDIWGARSDAVDGPLMHGLALIMHTYGDTLDIPRLADVLIDVVPRQIKARALAMRETHKGEVKKLVALVMVTGYNERSGAKLDPKQLDTAGKKVTR